MSTTLLEKPQEISVNSNKIKITVHIPDKVNEVVRQQKINLIYDLLKPKNKS